MKVSRLTIEQRDAGITVLVTETASERMRGLLGRDHLAANEALLLQRCWSIHTFGMRFAIDVLFLDRYQRIVAIHNTVPKRRMLLNLRAKQTLEMPAGSARVHGLTVGKRLSFEATQ